MATVEYVTDTHCVFCTYPIGTQKDLLTVQYIVQATTTLLVAQFNGSVNSLLRIMPQVLLSDAS